MVQAYSMLEKNINPSNVDRLSALLCVHADVEIGGAVSERAD